MDDEPGGCGCCLISFALGAAVIVIIQWAVVHVRIL